MKEPFQLEKEDIDNLFKWVKHKHVKHIDVQYEIVDHLASGMEDLMSEDPTMSKTKALYKVYEKFPITGFTNLVQEKSKALKRYWQLKFMRYLLDYLKLPKILILLAIFTVCINGLWKLLNFTVSVGQLQLVILVALIIFSFKLYSLKSEFKNPKTYLVLISYFEACWLTMYVPYFLLWCTSFGSRSELLSLQGVPGIIIAGFSSIWFIVLCANIFVFPKMLFKEIEKKYAHLNIELSDGFKFRKA